MEIVNQAFNCPECRCLLERPVAICCGQTVCLKHLENLENDVFFCKSCEQDHQIEKSSINVNKGYELLINANIKNINLGLEYKEAFDLCNQLDCIIHETLTLTTDPGYFLNDSIAKLKNKTQLLREQNKFMIDEEANKIILDLDKYEKECLTNIDSMHFKAKLINFNESINQIKSKLDDWKIKFNDFASGEDEWIKIKQESKKTISDFKTHLNDFKNQLLSNKINRYLSAVLDFGQITLKSILKSQDDLDNLHVLKEALKNQTDKDVSTSKIIDNSKKEKITKLCELSSDKNWKLIYRASKDGFSAEKFHFLCDDVPNTLTIIQSTEGYIFGGYTSQKWDQSNSYKNDSNAFLFSLENKENIPMKIEPIRFAGNSIYCGTEFGPCFGPDLQITDEKSFSCLGKSYQRRNCFTKNKRYHLTDSEIFTVSDIDIFQIF